MKKVDESALKFPCDCFTESPKCEEPWAMIAKKGVFKGGTREKILNLVHEKPRTIAQLSATLDLSQPTIHRHLSRLISGGLIKESEDAQRHYSVERYYRPAFPVVSESDQEKFGGILDRLADDMTQAFEARVPALRQLFAESDARTSGWSFEEFAQYLMQAAGRKARRSLEDDDTLAPSLHDSESGILFWATE